MAFAIKYCEKCGERVDPSAFENGTAITYRNESYCGDCKVEILPLMEQDPEYQAQLASSRRRGSSGIFNSPRASSIRARPPTLAGRNGGASSIHRRPQSGIRPAANPPSSRRAASGKMSRQSPPAGNKTVLIIGLSAVTILLIVVVVVGIALSSNNNPEPAEGSGGGTEQFQKARPTAIETGENARWKGAYEEAKAFQKQATDEVDDPNVKRDPIDADRAIFEKWESVASELADTPYETLARDSLRDARQGLEDRARNWFEHAERQSQAAMQAGRSQSSVSVARRHFDHARSAWEKFPEKLLFNEEWRSKVEAEKRGIDQAFADWERDRPVGPDPGTGPFLPPDPHGGGKPVPDGSWKVLQFPEGVEPRIRRVDAQTFELDNSAQDAPLIINLVNGFDTGAIQILCRVVSGYARFYGPGSHAFDVTGPMMATGDWIELTVQYGPREVKAWVGNTPIPVDPPTRAAGSGMLRLAVGPQSKFEVRHIALKGGNVAEGQRQPGPSASGEVALVDGTASRFQTQGAGTFTFEDGVLRCQNPGGQQSLLLAGDNSWGGGTLTFQVRDLEGAEEFIVVSNLTPQGEQMAGNPAPIKASYFTNPGQWTAVEVVISPDKIIVRVDGMQVSMADRPLKSGPLCFFFTASVDCRVRDVKIVLE